VKKRWMWFHDRFEPTEVHLHGFSDYIAGKETEYQKIEILQSPFFGKMLVIDGDVQSSERDEYIYHESLVHPALTILKKPENVLILGGGEGATLREILKHKTIKRVTMVDIDRESIEFAKKHLKEWHKGAFESEKLNLILGDALKIVNELKEGSFDAIISDVTEPFEGGPSYRLFTREFFEKLKRLLKKDGVFSLQASMLRNVTYELHRAIHWTLKEVFHLVFSYYSYVPSFDTTWGFCLASDELNPEDFSIEEIDRRIGERIEGELRFYDGETHKKLFLLPKDIREILKKKTNIIEEDKPFVLPKKNSL